MSIECLKQKVLSFDVGKLDIETLNNKNVDPKNKQNTNKSSTEDLGVHSDNLIPIETEELQPQSPRNEATKLKQTRKKMRLDEHCFHLIMNIEEKRLDRTNNDIASKRNFVEKLCKLLNVNDNLRSDNIFTNGSCMNDSKVNDKSEDSLDLNNNNTNKLEWK